MSRLTPLADAECLYTTVRNIATREKFFGFIPPHGRRLACGEEMNIWGDIQSWIAKYSGMNRVRPSFEKALVGDSDHDAALALVKTPAVHAFDSTTNQTNILTIDNDTTVWADPCWNAYSSSSIDCA